MLQIAYTKPSVRSLCLCFKCRSATLLRHFCLRLKPENDQSVKPYLAQDGNHISFGTRAPQIFNLRLQLCSSVQSDTPFHLGQCGGKSSCVYPLFVLSCSFLSHNHPVCVKYKIHALHIVPKHNSYYRTVRFD